MSRPAGEHAWKTCNHGTITQVQETRVEGVVVGAAGKADPKQERLAAPATIHRLELSHPELAGDDRYCHISLECLELVAPIERRR